MFLFDDADEDVGDELLRREKTLKERQTRLMKQREEQEELSKEEKWKALHMNMARSRTGLSFSLFQFKRYFQGIGNLDSRLMT